MNQDGTELMYILQYYCMVFIFYKHFQLTLY